ncbi:hypothetical protein LTR66_013537 [Elasticomyces elasticus]|nr:hypothetical protein LTR66_013537 [Elasticomyces elasticus]
MIAMKSPYKTEQSANYKRSKRSVNSRIGRADNARFLEHFRYLIVASQLLNEYPDPTSLQFPATQPQGLDGTTHDAGLTSAATNPGGVVATAVVAFLLAWLFHWARGSRHAGVHKSRSILVLAILIVATSICYAYVRRQWLKYLRQQAVEAASSLTRNLQALETLSTSALSLIQEVELVSRGYRISAPLPPISRLEDQRANRRCTRLRKALYKSYVVSIPVFTTACATLRPLLDEDDLERYLEIYDLRHQDINEALVERTECESEDTESLKTLRLHHFRLSTLRRTALCSLLALEADGAKSDFARWRIAVDTMESLSAVAVTAAEKLGKILSETEHFTVPPMPKAPSTPARERLRGQVRKINTLSQGIRGIQAKMQILREESNKSIDESEDLTDLGPILISQYDSIGADLKNLIQAWEAGKASLASNIDRHERRISMASSDLRSPALSLGGLTAVEEGSPADALRALNGDSPSNRSSLNASASDEEVFEAIALTKQRSVLTREERITKMHEERARQASLREKHDANTNMLKELESVINLRPKRNAVGRITSI